MVIREIKELIVRYRRLLKENGISPQIIMLYGSYARNTQTENSDIDIAVVSRSLGKDRFSEGSLLNRLGHKVHPKIEAIPIGLTDYLDPMNISPILSQIKSTGTPLL